MQLSQVLNPRRISRSLVTVLGLTLIQTIVPPVLAPHISTPKAEAVTDTYTPAQATSWTVPANVSSISVTLKGGAGGTGGYDCGDGCTNQIGGPRGVVTGTFSVSPGDNIGIFPGNKGGNGSNGATNSGGGTAGTDTALNNLFDGGTGGNAGSSGGSGGGGGGGAASVLIINGNIRAVAGGAGGGGGAANVANSGTPGYDYNSSNVNGSSYTGANGSTTSSCTTTNNGTTSDGGGSGGSGGGLYGGANRGVYAASTGECAGFGGSRGGNYLNEGGNNPNFNAGSSEPNSTSNGSIDITYTVNTSFSACSTNTQTVDIYTIVKITSTNSCTWSVPATVSVIDFFMVGAGGGGGADGGGGGGGGGAISRSAFGVAPSNSLTLTVGAGGGGGVFTLANALAGLATTLTYGSSTFTSNGGSPGTAGPSATNAAGGTTTNGTTAIGFAGGAGGQGGPTSGTSGTNGAAGTSNWYYGTQDSYGGGGGGGIFPNSTGTWTSRSGASGGGAGASSTGGVNQPGSDGGANTGGGGGGGAAAYTQSSGGRGGSGVILIRYATNSADSFPAALTSALAGRYMAGDLQLLDSTRKGWIDSSGKNVPVSNTNITATGLTITDQAPTDATYSTGSTKTLLTVKGTTSSKITFQNLSTGYTLYHVARYVRGGTANKIFTASGNDWTSGYYWGEGVSYHYNWLTDDRRSLTYNWQITGDQSKLLRAGGIDVTRNDDSIGTQLASVDNFGINNYNSFSDFEVNDVLIFSRELTIGEMRLLEKYLARINGITLSPFHNTSETDTAYSGTSTYSYMYQQTDTRNNLNDTFTVEAWLKPDATCNTGVCTYYARENSFRFVVRNGVYEFILYGDGAWQWVNTGIAIKSGEWHHVSISKTLAGNRGDSVKLYLDGQLVYTKAGSPYRTATTASTNSDASTLNQVTTWSYIGVITGGGERWYGLVDEVKIWKAARTQAEILDDMHSSDGSSPLLQAYYNMNYVAGTHVNQFKVPNLAYYGHPRSDLFNWDTDVISFADVKSVSTSGPYTTITFPRSYITEYGGWKVPESVTAATTIVVGGGGGAGKSDSNLSAPGGAGGGGGVTVVGRQLYTPGATLQIKVGAGGQGALTKADDASTRNGYVSYVGVDSGITALGGGGGGSNNYTGAGGSTIATGGGGGGNPSAGNCATQGPSGGTVTSGYNGATGGWGWGGAGGSARGAATTSGCYGIEGSGYVDSVTTAEYGRTGSNQSYGTWSTNSKYTTPNIGWGGSVSYGTSGAIASGAGMPGSAGVVIVRYISAAKPTYTKPTNAYLNVGMTETFTTNIPVDSATAVLTRTFKWESTTAGPSGTFTVIKSGTGATNASFSWIPSDTSTSGSNYLYRLTVTDSDTAGLFITDSSTAYAIIKGTLTLTGTSTIKKAINVSRGDTFTVTAGTSTYRYTLTPTIAGITLDTTTAMSPVINISDTATVGTFLETLTVIDSVSATVAIPITITISAPPTLTNLTDVVTTGQVFAIDASNSASYNTSTGAWSDISGSKRPITVNSSSGSPVYSNDYSGIVTLDNTKYQALSTTGIGKLTTWTIDSWVKLDASISAQACIMNSEYVNTNINYFLCFDTSRTVYSGFYIYNGYTYMRTTTVVPLNTWTHIVGTWNGAQAKVYINGTLAAGTEIYQNAGTSAPAPDASKTYIGKWWNTGFNTTASSYTPMTISSLRLYNLPLTETQVALNYNATKDRFATVNQKQITPAQKYGALNIETFTVTSGGDTKTVTFAIGNRTGIKWDTATAGVVKLSVQESLTPGTYYDTITVTDNFSQSTTLPIKFTISKADTITVTAGAATSKVYDKLAASSLPAFTFSGLVSSDSATVQRKYTGVDWTKPCSQGGGCEVGDTGPAGGTIFYISPTVIDSATGVSTGGTYLEMAPTGWWGSAGESTTAWAKAQTSVTGTSSAIGSGAENTRLINAGLTTNSLAAKIAADLTYGGKSDWFLPSTLEVKEMYDALYAPGLGGNLSVRNYWSSTQGSNAAQADTYWFGSGGLVSTTDKLNSFTLRPIRAYSPDTITVTTVPTNVDSYTVTVDTVTMTSGSLANYEGIIYQKSGLNISKARQDPLSVASFVANFGTPYTLTTLGGSGTGALTETLTAASVTLGCALTGHTLTTTTAGNCVLQMKKAYSRNYFTETATATVYYLVWATNQPAPAAGTGPNIALSGVTSITRDPNAAPTISSLSTYTAQAGVTQIVITGGFFDHNNPAGISVKFWRNKVASGFTVSADNTQITVTVPVGTTTGKVLVSTPNGIAVSELPLTITP